MESDIFTLMAGERRLKAQSHKGKPNMHKIESKHINLRTRTKRLARTNIFFFTRIKMHDIMILLFIKQYEFSGTI